jgi:hypothetical protein
LSPPQYEERYTDISVVPFTVALTCPAGLKERREWEMEKRMKKLEWRKEWGWRIGYQDNPTLSLQLTVNCLPMYWIWGSVYRIVWAFERERKASKRYRRAMWCVSTGLEKETKKWKWKGARSLHFWAIQPLQLAKWRYLMPWIESWEI